MRTSRLQRDRLIKDASYPPWQFPASTAPRQQSSTLLDGPRVSPVAAPHRGVQGGSRPAIVLQPLLSTNDDPGSRADARDDRTLTRQSCPMRAHACSPPKTRALVGDRSPWRVIVFLVIKLIASCGRERGEQRKFERAVDSWNRRGGQNDEEKLAELRARLVFARAQRKEHQEFLKTPCSPGTKKTIGTRSTGWKADPDSGVPLR